MPLIDSSHCRLLLVTAVLFPAQSLATEPLFSLVTSEPRVISSDRHGQVVSFGPARLLFPAGWVFERSGTLARGKDASGTTAAVSVLVASERLIASGVMAPERLAYARRRIASEVKNFCNPAADLPIETVSDGEEIVIYVGGCEETHSGLVSFAVQYDIYTPKVVTQLTISGGGTYSRARSSYDKVASSHRW
jgi:hypothetical protein